MVVGGRCGEGEDLAVKHVLAKKDRGVGGNFSTAERHREMGCAISER